MKKPALFLLLLELLLVLTIEKLEARPLKAQTKNEEVPLNGRSNVTPTHLLQMEHKEIDHRPNIKNAVKRMLSSKTIIAMDEVVSSMVALAGGMVDDLGDLMVKKIDMLPETIREVSDAVGKAVELKRKKVQTLIKGTKLEDDVKNAKESADRIAVAVEYSKFRTSLQLLEQRFASLVGKFIGATSNNADNINSAFNSGLKKLAGAEKREQQSTQSKIVKLLEDESSGKLDKYNDIDSVN